MVNRVDNPRGDIPSVVRNIKGEYRTESTYDCLVAQLTKINIMVLLAYILSVYNQLSMSLLS